MRTAISRPAPLAGAGTGTGPGSPAIAVRQALARTPAARLVLLFACPGLGPGDVARQAQDAAGDVPVVGLTSDACLGGEGLLEGGCSALALGAPLVCEVAVADAREAGLRAAARSAAARAMGAVGGHGGHALLLLLLDARSGDQADAVAGAYEVAGATVPIAGGAAAGEPTAQLALGRALEHAVVAVAVRSPARISVGAAHGCRPRGVPAIVTRAEGRVVRELDGRPALDVYLEKAGRSGAHPGREELGRLASIHPLAQPELSGDVRLRHVVDVDGRGLVCATRIPENAAVHVGEQEVEDLVASTAVAVRRATAGLRGSRPAAVLAFDCAGRRHALGSSLEREGRAVVEALGDGPPPLAGAYTRGEIGRVRGAKGDRNHALVVVAFA